MGWKYQKRDELWGLFRTEAEMRVSVRPKTPKYMEGSTFVAKVHQKWRAVVTNGKLTAHLEFANSRQWRRSHRPGLRMPWRSEPLMSLMSKRRRADAVLAGPGRGAPGKKRAKKVRKNPLESPYAGLLNVAGEDGPNAREQAVLKGFS
jgi:hypothetical protein